MGKFRPYYLRTAVPNLFTPLNDRTRDESQTEMQHFVKIKTPKNSSLQSTFLRCGSVQRGCKETIFELVSVMDDVFALNEMSYLYCAH
jgi:hypothetical protein